MDQSWRRRLFVVVSALALMAGCGGNATLGGAVAGPPATGAGTTTPPATGGGSSTPPASTLPVQHVIVVVEENHSYESVIGNPGMPYLNGLANRYGLATAYFANTHPSIGNYFMLTTGAIVTNDDGFTGTVTSDNLSRVLKTAGKSWKVYAESLPSPGYLGGDTGSYVKRHNPFAYFSDVINDSAQAQNIVPFSQFSSDLASGLPNYAFVVPDLDNDAHNGTLAAADAWLKNNIDPLVTNPSFQQSGLLLIVFDEGFEFDIANGGGRVAAILVGSKVKSGFRSTTFYQHESALRLMLEALGVATLPGAAAGAGSMTEFLQ